MPPSTLLQLPPGLNEAGVLKQSSAVLEVVRGLDRVEPGSLLQFRESLRILTELAERQSEIVVCSGVLALLRQRSFKSGASAFEVEFAELEALEAIAQEGRVDQLRACRALQRGERDDVERGAWVQRHGSTEVVFGQLFGALPRGRRTAQIVTTGPFAVQAAQV